MRRFALAADRAPCPLSALYLLDWGEPAITRLRGVEAVRALIAAAGYRTELLRDPAALERYWRQMAGIVARVPVSRLSRPRDWSRLADTLAPIVT